MGGVWRFEIQAQEMSLAVENCACKHDDDDDHHHQKITF